VIATLEPRPNMARLDAACGTGELAFRAAAAGATVTGLDFAASLVDTARRAAAARGLDIRFDVGDAEAMPYGDGAFAVISSTFGCMFARDHAAVARELARVVQPAGRLALAAWTPDSTVADLFRLFARFGPPLPAGLPSPFDWGDETYGATLLGDASELSFEHHETALRAPSGEEDWDLFSSAPGPLKALAASLDDHGRAKLRETWIRWAEGMRQGAEIVNRRAYLLTLGTRH